MRKLISGSNFLSFSANALVAIAGFISIWALARNFQPAELGQWLLFLTAFTFMDMLRSGFIQTALLRYATQQNKEAVIGSAWVIGILISVALAILVLLFTSGIDYFTQYNIATKNSIYLQILILVSFPHSISLWLQQAEEQFNRIIYLRLFLTLPFLIYIVSGFILSFSVENLTQVYIAGYLGSSVAAIVCGWSGIQAIFKAKLATIRTLCNFGKYSMGTLIGANLLKSTDTFMISWYLGPSSVATYTLPYKLVEIVEIPLRSLVATYLPKSTKYSSQNNLSGIKRLFDQYTGFLTLMILPLLIFCFIYAREIISVLAGEKYASSADIFRYFVVYSLFLPLDRFLGVTLDVLGKPYWNLCKVYTMVAINFAGNLAAIKLFASPVLVAGATIVTIVTGIGMGWFMLKGLLPIRLKEVGRQGYVVFHQFIHKHFRSSIA